LAASCSADNTVYIFDPFTWVLIRKYLEHTKEVYFIDQIDSDTLVSAAHDYTLRIWKISTGQTLRKIEIPSLTYVSRYLSNGLIACGLVGLIEKNLLIYNFTSYAYYDPVKTLIGHIKTIYSIEILSDDLIASGGYDTKVITWNLTTSKAKNSFIRHEDRVFCVKKLSSNRVASADRAGIIFLWDWNTGSYLQKLTGHTNQLWTTSLDLFDAHTLISGSIDKTIKFWNISSGELIQSVNVDIQINAFAMLKSGSK
jgi:WD40 repeat protein